MESYADGMPTSGRLMFTAPGGRVRLALFAALMLFAGLTLTPSQASAAPNHPFQSSFNGATSTAGALAGVSSIAINQSTGRIYAIDAGRGVVDQFDADGTPVNFSALGQSSLYPIAKCNSSFAFDEAYIAVDNSGGANEGDIYFIANNYAVCAYDPAGNFLWSMPPTGYNCGFATDSQGHIWISSYYENRVEEFGNDGSAGHPPALIGQIAGTTGHPCRLAFDSSGPPGVAFIGEYEGQVDKYVSGTFNATYDPGFASSIAVDPGSHHLYALRGTSFSEYDASGAPAPAVSQSGAPVLQNGVGIVVNGTGAGGVPAGTVYVSDNATNRIVQFGPLGSYPEATVTAPTGVERGSAVLHGHVDPAEGGNVTSCHFEVVTSQAYEQTGFTDLSSGDSVPCDQPTPLSSATDVSGTATLTGKGLNGGTDYVYRLVLGNSSGTNSSQTETLPLPAAVQSLQTDDVSDSTGHGITLNGSFTGDSNDTHFYFEYGTDSTYGKTSPAPPGDDAGSPTGTKNVSTQVAGLETDVIYHYRVVASNKFGTTLGEDRSFALETPAIDAFAAANVTATSADLTAQINPHGQVTKYHFEYGPASSYGSVVPIPDGELPAATTDQTITVHLEDLTPRTTYHFRVVVENASGRVVSEDQTFNFFPANCPNAHVRQETGANSLPDCRAYELASAEYPGSALIFSAPGPAALESAPGRVSYVGIFGAIPETGVPANAGGDLYVATRTTEGWVTKYIGLPGNESQQTGGPPGNGVPAILGQGPEAAQRGVLANPSLSKVISWDRGAARGGNSEEHHIEPGTSNAPFIWDTATNAELGRLPTNVAEIPEGVNFIGGRPAVSADFSHFIFSSDIPFVPGAAPEVVYDNNTKTGQVTVASVKEGNVQFKGTPVKVSSEGSHILISAPPSSVVEPFFLPSEPVELFMRVNDAITYEIAAGHKVSYVGMTDDGSKVYFTSTESLTAEDQDFSADLYMWSEDTDSLKLVSQGSEGSGNSDACSASWTTKCGVVPIDFTAYSKIQGGLGGDGVTDSAMAAKNGEIYFYSPERLDGPSKGVPGMENLYVFRNGGLQFVAALSTEPVCSGDQGGAVCASGPISRMDVSPDGSHVAFIATTQLTSYENAGHSEMYSYTPATRKLTCDSCLSNGEPPTEEVYASQKGLFMTDDGRAFFSTEEALVPQDTNDVTDIYEFTEGRPQLISAGTGTGNAEIGAIFIGFAGIDYPGLVQVSADGTDVFFSTFDVLVGQDRNGHNLKIYDARTGGGIPFKPPPPGCVAADECHGAGSSPPPALAKGSSTVSRSGNLSPPKSNKKKKGKHRGKRHRKTHKKHGADR